MVTATLGDDARLSCRLTQMKDVVQITWQRFLPAESTFIASYSERFGERVNPKLEGKVEFADTELQRTSIVVKNLTREDECCYSCMFNAVPEGALTGRTCLQVYELHGPVLRTGGGDSTVVSCWATGRPAPIVTVGVLQKDPHLVINSTVRVANSNGTTTVNTTAILSSHHGISTQVVCRAQVFSSNQTATLILPDLDKEPQPQSSIFVKELELNFSNHYVLFIVPALILILGISLVIVRLKLRNKKDSSKC